MEEEEEGAARMMDCAVRARGRLFYFHPENSQWLTLQTMEEVEEG